MPIRLVVFDLDDTLFDTYHGAEAALVATSAETRRLHPELTDEQVRRAWRAALHESEDHLGSGALAREEVARMRIRDVYHQRWGRVLEICQVAPENGAPLGDHYLACRRGHYRLYPDVEEVLPRILADYPAALLTNGLGDFQWEKVRSVQLERWITRVYVTGEVGTWKPHAGAFRHALEQAGCEPAEAVMIGDSLHHDIAGAAAVGMRTVWVRRHRQAERAGVRPDAVIEDLRPLPDLLARWNAAE